MIFMTKKVVVITGAAAGIGLAIARCFAKAGETVVILDLHQQSITAAIDLLTSENISLAGFVCDVTREEEIAGVFNMIQHQFGGIDILINNAGLQHVAPIESFPTDKFRYLLEVMLVAPFMAIKQVLPGMRLKKFGRIINMASINGLIGFAGKSAYNSAKHGVIGLTRVTALETAEDGITVNAVCPGYVDTALVRDQLRDLAVHRGITMEKVLEEVIYPLVPQKRLLSVDEIAHYVLFLAGENAGGITGQVVVIDGGYTAQ